MPTSSHIPWVTSVEDADQLLLGSDLEVRVADVRWYLDGRSGSAAFASGHLPEATFVDLDTVLAAPATAESGRHPLPDPETFAAGMEAAGIAENTVVIAYDDASGGSASRLVWLLRATGHTATLLDGGIQAWARQHGADALETGAGDEIPAPAGSFRRTPVNPEWLATMHDAETAASDGLPLLDSRAPERYRGEVEPMDPWAGHIPGALNVFHAENIGTDGHFLAAVDLRKRFGEAGVDGDTEPIVYCGSGVTACHNLVALEAAGLHGRLYPGSWSQYSALHPEPGDVSGS
ncbi:sulfurtransferase [Kocuria sp. TGY1127_2]|uniref:sulfurtransferase n=1 Tax=Kocuria sp. TGY1127_2 TaxID=2711328 RepID=UPI0015B7AA32|nr:sulfurtransferase [Kocuria sp. TGY1127_2]